jgi:type I restriction enzyme R subunit
VKKEMLMANFYTPGVALDSYRRRLPHWQQVDTWCFITFRLRDSLPGTKLDLWRRERDEWLKTHPQPRSIKDHSDYHRTFTARIEHWLDQGSGSCVLRKPAAGRIVTEALLYFDEERYRLDSFVVMPNHVHVLMHPLGEWTLHGILKSWKSFSARQINGLNGTSGSLWQLESWDRLIRDQTHFRRCRAYIRNNPAKAGLKEGFVFWQRAERNANLQIRNYSQDRKGDTK